MASHLRANLWLLGLTVLICAGLYPLVLWGIGQTVFHDQAQGSLIKDEKGNPIGSRLIAQEFKGDEYFQPRPSAASYNGAASGASNLGANNYQLRDRVAKQLGPIVRYGKGAEKPGELVGPDIEKWFQADRYHNQSGIVAQWAAMHSALAEGWVKDTDTALKAEANKAGNGQEDQGLPSGQYFLMQLLFDEPDLHKSLAPGLKALESASPAEVAKDFFPLFSKRYPGEWPTLEDYETKDKLKRKKLVRTKQSTDIQSVFFDMWRQDHPNVSLEEVPADMVTASASGLDPHITLKNAQYQLKYRIKDAQAQKIIREQAKLEAKKLSKDWGNLDENQAKELEEKARKVIEAKVGKHLEDRLDEVIGELLTKSASAPLGGLAGVPLINVLEINVAMNQRLKQLVGPSQ
jgi:K+-transporting ATPase ATPase C chain